MPQYSNYACFISKIIKNRSTIIKNNYFTVKLVNIAHSNPNRLSFVHRTVRTREAYVCDPDTPPWRAHAAALAMKYCYIGQYYFQ